ncbi:MAG: hypothetical protein ACKPGT_27745, partial [Microcystis sp.]
MANLSLDTTLTGTLDPGRETQLYQFTGNAGQRLYFDDLGSQTGANWNLYQGNNQSVSSGSLNSDREFVLSNSGTYILALQGNSNTPVAYNLRLVNAQTTPTALTLGTEVNGSIAKPGEQDEYTFTGIVGQRLYFDNLGSNTSLTA